MEDHLNILIADEDPSVAQGIAEILRPLGHACTTATDAQEAVEEARSGAYELVIADMRLGDGAGRQVLRAGRAARPEAQVIVTVREGSASEAYTAMGEGATTFLQKPLNMAQLVAIVERAADYVSLHRDREALQSQVVSRYGLENIIGNSRPMLKVFVRIKQAAATDATVLIQGETGTGKELVARAIHYNSSRASNRFVPLNCAGLLETILESQLFGHEKGAFTGATSSRIGLFEYANHGTLFLDEIGDMPPASQLKLLRVLEEGEIVRVGSNEPIKVDVRLVAATNKNLRETLKDNQFRRELFYRLSVLTINLPPLRERQADIALLIEHFLARLMESYGKTVRGFTPGVKRFLFRYEWPGNVRELKNCLEHMVVVAKNDVLSEDDLPEYLLAESEGLLLSEPTVSSMVGQPLKEVEKHHIARTLEIVEGNREKAAELLGIGERTLYRKIEKYGLR